MNCSCEFRSVRCAHVCSSRRAYGARSCRVYVELMHTPKRDYPVRPERSRASGEVEGDYLRAQFRRRRSTTPALASSPQSLVASLKLLPH